MGCTLCQSLKGNNMGGGYASAGVLNDAYGAAYAGGQRFFTWTNDAFNPTAWGGSTRMIPASAPELVGTSGSISVGTNTGLANLAANVPTWNLVKSPVVWVVAALLIGIPLYHWYEYGR